MERKEPASAAGKPADGPIYLQWRGGSYPVHGERLKGFVNQVNNCISPFTITAAFHQGPGCCSPGKCRSAKECPNQYLATRHCQFNEKFPSWDLVL